MNLSVGIVGLPNVGKSTLFNALLKKSASAKASAGQAGHAITANYPFTTIEPNVGVVEVPDKRLQKLAEIIANENPKSETRNPKQILNTNDPHYAEASRGKQNSGEILNQVQDDRQGWPPIVPAVVQFVDIAGLVKGAHMGEGLGNKFLSHIREVDAIVFVVRDFKSEDIINTGENPKDDLEVLKTELLMKDLETVEKRLDILERELKPLGPNDPKRLTLAVMEHSKKLVAEGKWLGDELTEEDLVKISELSLLSAKKIIVVVNSDESDLSQSSEIEGAIRISAKLEEDLAVLSPDEQKDYLKELGIEESGLARLATQAYEVLGLETFLTAGPKEVRAWTIKKGSLAPQAAGVIHSDFERGFIAADTVTFDKFVEVGGWKEARAKGLVKTIGKSEVMPQDCVVEFKFSV